MMPSRAEQDVGTAETVARHEQLGLDDTDVVGMFRTMLLARRVDERLLALNRQGRIPFVLPGSGHEAAQVGVAAALDVGRDWVLPYYRDLGLILALGVSPTDLFLSTFAKADDPASGGRQMPNHWSARDLNIFTHSSVIATQFPHAVGIAHEIRRSGSDAVVLVSSGEGATSEGDWHEAMNWAGIHGLPVIFLVENNRYSISVPSDQQVAGRVADRAAGYGMPGVTVDGNDLLAVFEAASTAVDRARTGGGPTLIEAETYRYYAHTSDDDDKLYRSREEVEQWRRRDPIPAFRQYLIEQRLLTDADEMALEAQIIDEVAAAVSDAEDAPEPENPLDHVYALPISPSTAVEQPEPVAGDGQVVNLITAVNRTLHELMERDDRVVVFGEDVADPKGGVFKATVGLTDRFGEIRAFNAPIAESAIVGTAIGMAAADGRPIAEIQFADFIHPAFDQIVSEAARIHYRSNGSWNCPLVIRVPYGGGIHGALYHSQSIEAFYAHVPGLKVVVPSTPADLKGLLTSAVEDPDPVMVLEPKRLYRSVKGPFPNGRHRVPLGQAAIRHIGDDLTIVAYGAVVPDAIDAAQQLAADGIGATVIDLRTLRPLDWPTIARSISRTSRLLIVHEDNAFLGYGAEIAAHAAYHSFHELDAPVTRYTAPEIPTYPYNRHLEHQTMPSTEGIVDHARRLVAF